MHSAPKNPRVKEIWYIDFDKESVGKEIDATESKKGNPRPAIVISDPQTLSFDSDKSAINNLRIVLPLLSHWESEYEHIQWFDKIIKSPRNGLRNDSTVAIYQIRSCDVERFHQYLGSIDTKKFKEILLQVSICIDMGTYYEIVEKNK